MYIKHRFNRLIAGMLVCTLCGMVIYEVVEDKKPQLHIPERNLNNATNQNPINVTASGTASMVAGTIIFTQSG